ncbi:uncharacterized protein [Miscanthus floridulus]|uniref:uncharacterized protein isoform X2 n=1 Tax=Miscanthus floridulus TaxID=154761 RepID=UPI003459115F
MQRTVGRLPPYRCLGAAPISSAHAPAQQPRHGSSSRRLDRGQAASRRRGCRFRPRPRTLVWLVAMAGRGGGSKSSSLYAVLGVASDCSDAELRSAYRKLAMKWHPDKCAVAGSSAGSADAAKARFQKIQGAYAVLSDPNKRILYDVGAYDGEGDDDLNFCFPRLAGRRGDPRRYSGGHEPGRPRRQRQGGEPGGPAAAIRGAVPEAVAVLLLAAERCSWEVGVREEAYREQVDCGVWYKAAL